MPVGAPAEQAIQLFNELSTKMPADAREVASISWRLRKIARTRPNDAVIGLALLLADLMLGNVDSAISRADHLWLLRHAMPGPELGIFLGELLQLGMHERAGTILNDVRGHPIEGEIPNLIGVYIRVAWDSGSAGQLDAIVKSPVGKSALASWETFLNSLNRIGLTPYLPGRQKIVHDIVFGKQCFSEFILTGSADDSDEMELSHYIYINSDYDECMEIEESIRNSLDKYFLGNETQGVNHWDVIGEVLVPVTAAPSWHEKNLGHVA